MASTSSSTATFAGFSPSLHPLLLRSLSTLAFAVPTPIQAALIPQALSSSSDILARARTGSGKTLAYAIPIVQSILQHRDRAQGNAARTGTKALILVPTSELAQQVKGQVSKLLDGLGLQEKDRVKILNAAGDGRRHGKGKRAKLNAEDDATASREEDEHAPEIVVATPAKALIQLRKESLSLEHLDHLVIDEADLILSYGHSSDDIRSILSGPWKLPKVYQSFLMSATMTTDVEELKGVVLRDPVIMKLDERIDEIANLSQYCLKCSEEDKFLLLYVILKLKLVKGKVLIFVNNTDRSYRLKLFLENFGIRSGVLNSELPFNSRYHAVEEFNRGVFNYLIATDESGLEGVDQDSDNEEEPVVHTLLATQPGQDVSEEKAPEPSTSKKRKRSSKAAGKSSAETEYGVSRGVDFVDVACVLNFDLPYSSRSYTHRVGRTARAGRTGTSLSFIVPKATWTKDSGAAKKMDINLPSARRDEAVWKRVAKAQKDKGAEIKDYEFEMGQIEGFRYRLGDALRAVTKGNVKEARIKEIKNEVINSDKLKAHFEDNPKDLAFLRHDKPLHSVRVQPHLKHVPSYLMPRIASVGTSTGVDLTPGESSGLREGGMTATFKKHRGGGGGGRGGKGGKGKRSDPLKGGKSKFGGGKKKK